MNPLSLAYKMIVGNGIPYYGFLAAITMYPSAPLPVAWSAAWVKCLPVVKSTSGRSIFLSHARISAPSRLATICRTIQPTHRYDLRFAIRENLPAAESQHTVLLATHPRCRQSTTTNLQGLELQPHFVSGRSTPVVFLGIDPRSLRNQEGFGIENFGKAVPGHSANNSEIWRQ